MERPTEEIAKKADQYAKRLLVRKQDPDQSLESSSKTLLRRKKIMDAISKNGTTTTRAIISNKPQLAESGDDQTEQDKSYVSTWPEERVEHELSAATATNCNQFRRDFLDGLLHQPLAATPKSNPTKCQPKISLGEYFGAKSHKEMRASNFLSGPSGRRKSERKLEREQERKQELMCARVLEVLEPEVVQVEQTDTRLVQEEWWTAPEADSTLASFVSEEARELDRQIEKLHLQPNAIGAPPDTTSKTSVYPSLASMERRMSERCSVEDDVPRSTPPPPAPMPDWQRWADNRQEQSAASPGSISRANASFLLGNSCEPRIRSRRKPNLESTRKQPTQLSAQLSSQLSPSRHGTSISTLTLPNTPYSPFGQRTSAGRDGDELEEEEDPVPIEVQNFLKLALGDECYSGSVSALDCATPTMTKRSGALDRSLSFYKTLRNSIRKRFKADGKREPRLLQQDSKRHAQLRARELQAPEVKGMLDLLEVYQTQIYQASKALDLCNSMREFQRSAERLEVERLLALASLGKLAARDQIRKLGAAGREPAFRERAELTIADLSVALREQLLRRGGGTESPEGVEWLMCVVREGPRVWASQAVACPPAGPRVHFPGSLRLPGLAPDFRLSVGVYSMRLRPCGHYNHEDKYHIVAADRQRARSCPWPSPRRILAACSPTRPTRSPKHQRPGFSGVRQSAFQLRASLELGLEQLQPARSAWPLHVLQADSALGPSLGMELRCRLRLGVRHAGFLTLGDEPGGLIYWSRRWCVLEASSLLFWNYPREQEDERPAMHEIDLQDCLSRRIEPAERSLCPRPRTLLLETARRRGPADEDSMVFRCQRNWTIVRNLLSCDTQQDLVEWQSKLNHVLCALREWNLALDTDSLQVSDL